MSRPFITTVQTWVRKTLLSVKRIGINFKPHSGSEDPPRRPVLEPLGSGALPPTFLLQTYYTVLVLPTGSSVWGHGPVSVPRTMEIKGSSSFRTEVPVYSVASQSLVHSLDSLHSSRSSLS